MIAVYPDIVDSGHTYYLSQVVPKVNLSDES